MRIEIKVPQMGESVNEATVSALIKPSGSSVAMDEEVIELETDKVNQVLPAPRAGVILWQVKVGDVVKIGQVVGSIDTEAASKEAPKAEGPPAKKEEVQKAPLEAAPPPRAEPQLSGARYTENAFIEDLKKGKEAPALQAAESRAPQPGRPQPGAPQPAPTAGAPHETRQRMSKIRQTIAKRLVESLQTSAMLTTFNEIDMSEVMALRSKYKELFPKKHGVKLGFMSWFVKGVISALKEIPALNSYIDGDEVVHREYYHIGIAVGTERGLVVPVLRDADKLSFAGIESAIVNFAKKARDNKLTVDDMRGGGFTITNGGIYGSLLSTPILNPPQSGILGMHAIQERPVVVNGQVVIRPMMYTALSYDHRLVDGQGAVTFLVRLKNCLEDPSQLLLDI